MICLSTSKRATGEQALAHPWFVKCLKNKQGTVALVDEQAFNRLRAFKGSSTLKKAALNVLVKMLSPADIESLR